MIAKLRGLKEELKIYISCKTPRNRKRLLMNNNKKSLSIPKILSKRRNLEKVKENFKTPALYALHAFLTEFRLFRKQKEVRGLDLKIPQVKENKKYTLDAKL